MKKIFLGFVLFIFAFFAFAEKRMAVWVIEEGGFWDSDIGISFLTADSVSLENGFVKLENNIKYKDLGYDADFDRVLNAANKYYKESKAMGSGIFLINANRVFAIREFNE